MGSTSSLTGNSIAALTACPFKNPHPFVGPANRHYSSFALVSFGGLAFKAPGVGSRQPPCPPRFMIVFFSCAITRNACRSWRAEPNQCCPAPVVRTKPESEARSSPHYRGRAPQVRTKHRGQSRPVESSEYPTAWMPADNSVNAIRAEIPRKRLPLHLKSDNLPVKIEYAYIDFSTERMLMLFHGTADTSVHSPTRPTKVDNGGYRPPCQYR